MEAKNHEIKTERLLLRPLTQDDVPKIFDILSRHPDITQFMGFDPPQQINETQEYFEKAKKRVEKGELIRWAITKDEIFMGIISLEDIVRKDRAWVMDTGGLGYWLDPDYHGQGFMTEAAQAVVAFGFQTLGLHKITVGHVADNTGSQRVIEKCGFRFLGEQKDHFKRFGKWWHHKIYEMTVDEWQSHNS